MLTISYEMKGDPFLCRAPAVRPDHNPCSGLSILSEVKPLTGEPCAGNPHARFGGRGDRTQPVLPTPIRRSIATRWLTRRACPGPCHVAAFEGRPVFQGRQREDGMSVCRVATVDS